ncbi:hypothetical protein [Rhodococcus aetherivorans]|uniref:hypothetical protein n=1 Tax=Rhodococcus aetherivorans TaxID=191292 RepID=UPI0002D2476E|nr:hypothetical protein [Rhodococcus aetherivorans]CCW14596.1 hypothetical protein EBESD8_51660 [Rhodococcus aetherivorans]
MAHPDYRLVDDVARDLGVPVGVVVGACGALGVDCSEGVHRSYTESIRQVVLQWAREGRLG